MWATDRTADYSQTEESAEYVLEESRRKKGGWRKSEPWNATFAPLRTRGGNFRYVHLQKSKCNHGHQLQHYSRYWYTICPALSIDQAYLSFGLSMCLPSNFCLSLSLSLFAADNWTPHFKQVGRCLFSIPEYRNIFLWAIKIYTGKVVIGPPDLVGHKKHWNKAPCFFTIRSFLTKARRIDWLIICQATIDYENWQLRSPPIVESAVIIHCSTQFDGRATLK